MTERNNDQAWCWLAEQSRVALRHLGWNIGPRCLPGEPDECGGTFAQHTVAHMAALTAVINHHLAHLSAAYGAETVADWGQCAYTDVALELAGGCAGAATIGEDVNDRIRGGR